MPLYDYKCQKCGTVREVLMKVNDKSEQVCECGEFMTRQIGRLGNIEFKGSGFYSTDYGKGGHK